MGQLRERLRDYIVDLTDKRKRPQRIRNMVQRFRPVRPEGKVDPGVSYPSYKSFDEFIDLERLKSLDKYVIDRVVRHCSLDSDEKFRTGVNKLNIFDSKRPGSRIIQLNTTDSNDIFDFSQPDKWRLAEEASEFSKLMEFIGTLPFEATGRIAIIFEDRGRPVTAHRDHGSTQYLQDFMWFRTNLAKPFYMIDWKSKKKCYVASYSAWFDTVNQYHGADATDELSFSIRVDGRFTDEFRKNIPTPVTNLASTPSFWASRSPGVGDAG